MRFEVFESWESKGFYLCFLKGVGVQFYVDVPANCVFFVFLGRGFGGNDFFVGEVSFENVVQVMGFTYIS